jgi:hypothetical protein
MTTTKEQILEVAGLAKPLSKVTTIRAYVKKNYKKLPKSTFSDSGASKELVIVKEITNWNEGYGHHDYEGIGIDEDGKVFVCQSGGCSCYSNVSWSENDTDLSDLKWKDLDFERLSQEFSSYE